MNKNLKKLGLLIVTAIAMAMGVNGASALTIGTRTNDFDENPLVGDGYVNTATVSHTGLNAYTITLNGDFSNAITVRAGEKVTIELNGKTLSANVSNAGSLVINGNTSSNVVKKITNSGNLTINGGNFVKATFVNSGSIRINGIGTAIPSNMSGYITSGFKGVPTESLTDSYLVLAEADAEIGVLTYSLEGHSVSQGVNVAADVILANEKLYTKSSFAVWKAAYETAKALYDARPIPVSRQAEVDAAVAAYSSAFKGLRYLATTSYAKVDKAIKDAQEKIDYNAKHGVTFTDASLKVLYDAIKYARANNDLPGDVNKWNAEVDAMATAIDNARMSLKVKVDYTPITNLEKVIAALNKANYTTESWNLIEFVENSINRDLADSPESRELVAEWADQLETALKGLVRISNSSIVTPGSDNPSNPDVTDPAGTNPGSTTPGTTNPSTTEGGNNNSGSTVNPNTGATGTTSDVNTSDNVAVYAVMNIASLIALAGCGLVLRKQN